MGQGGLGKQSTGSRNISSHVRSFVGEFFWWLDGSIVELERVDCASSGGVW